MPSATSVQTGSVSHDFDRTGHRAIMDGANGRSLGELIELVGIGDQCAFKDFYDRTADELFALAMATMPNRQSACQLLFDGYLEFWRLAPGYVPASEPAICWIMRIFADRIRHDRVPDKGSRTAPENGECRRSYRAEA